MTFDAGSRLAEGRPAVDTFQDYVWASHLVGYQDPDLTLHASQVHDWYSSEDGLDLRALDEDCEGLRAAATAAESALARQQAQLAAVSNAWQGAGAIAAQAFLKRHNDAATGAVAAVRTATEALAVLRDELWRSVDDKVVTTSAIGARGANPEWSAAAQTVTTGAGDRATASELVDQEVKPFVDNDIRSEWLSSVRATIAAITSAYESAVAQLTAEGSADFDVPGDLGPSWLPSGDTAATTPAAAASPAPAGASMSWTPGPQPVSPTFASAAPLPPSAPSPESPATAPSAPAPVEPAAMAPSMPSLGGGMPDIGSGFSGFGQQLGDLLGGLLGTSPDELSEFDDLEPPDDVSEPEDDELGPDEEPDPEREEELGESDELGVDEIATDADDLPATPECEAPPEVPPAEPAPVDAPPTAVEPAPMPAAVPPPPPASVAGTPCEIAADELPQVGE